MSLYVGYIQVKYNNLLLNFQKIQYFILFHFLTIYIIFSHFLNRHLNGIKVIYGNIIKV